MPYPIALSELAGTTVRLSIAQQAQVTPSQFLSNRDKHFCTAVRDGLSRSLRGLLSGGLFGLEEIESRFGP
jgi:hypothetical protein